MLDGFHGSCFAYGATGSGKTFTMTGSAEHPGVMPRAIEELFSRAAKEKDELKWRFSLVYVEIYNERVKDLLNPMSGVDLDVREDARKGTHVAGAVEVAVTSLREIMELMNKGNLYRTTEATNCNEVSSRSHAVLQVNCVGVERFVEGANAKKQTSRLSLIDLAGSERAYKTENSGDRLREGRNINRSLLALGNCINALADKTKRSATCHTEIRSSHASCATRPAARRSRDLRVSPASDQFEETLNTLKYANRAKDGSLAQRNVAEFNPVSEQVEVLKDPKVFTPDDERSPSPPPRCRSAAMAGRAGSRRGRRNRPEIKDVRGRRGSSAFGAREVAAAAAAEAEAEAAATRIVSPPEAAVPTGRRRRVATTAGTAPALPGGGGGGHRRTPSGGSESSAHERRVNVI